MTDIEDCPAHSTYWLHLAVANNRRLLGDPPQPCTCDARAQEVEHG